MSLPTDYQNFIALSRYARWLPEQNRREMWDETVTRYMDYVWETVAKRNAALYGNIELKKELWTAVHDLEVMPSMRAMMTAGPALDRCNVCSYNCAYVPIDDARAFDETMYILMCGTGVGFSVERENVNKLPSVPAALNSVRSSDSPVIVVGDSKAGWATALRQLFEHLYSGTVPKWDVTNVRPAGAPLKTFGGRASGPAPLVELFQFVTDVMVQASGRKLYPIECHDIMCKIGEVVVVGGVRRSALISLSNLGDEAMRRSKMGNWYIDNVQRALANNSVAYKGKPSMEVFFNEWKSLYDSKSGERGIFNRAAAIAQVEDLPFRTNLDQSGEQIMWGCNPCSEIILRPYQFCNLSEVVLRAHDTMDRIKRKVQLATILGTMQACLTDFEYLRPIWKENTEDERLLGVSLTGIMDHAMLSDTQLAPPRLIELRNAAREMNAVVASKLGIRVSAAITCVKPSGTVSQLVDSASGIHPRHSQHYIRTVRADNKDPMTQFMKDVGVPNEPDVTKPDSTTVFSFPVQAPTEGKTREDLTAIHHLQIWRMYQRYWCDHKPSITVNVHEHEWLRVGDWVYENFDAISGISFLPYSEHEYAQAPYQECDEERYNECVAASPKSVDWTKLTEYETGGDTTSGSQELACTAGVCEVVDIQSR